MTIEEILGSKDFFEEPILIGMLIEKLNSMNITELTVPPLIQTSFTPDDIRLLFNALEKTPRIKTLKFENTNLDDACSMAIAKHLKSNTTLEKVDISYECLSFVAYFALAKAVVDNKTLNRLELRSNSFDDINVIALALTPFMPACIHFNLRGHSVYDLGGFTQYHKYIKVDDPKFFNCELSPALLRIESAYSVCPPNRLKIVQSMLKKHIQEIDKKRVQTDQSYAKPIIFSNISDSEILNSELMKTCLEKMDENNPRTTTDCNVM